MVIIAIAGVIFLLWLAIQVVGSIIGFWVAHRTNPERMEKKYPDSQYRVTQEPTGGSAPRSSHAMGDLGRARRWYRRIR